LTTTVAELAERVMVLGQAAEDAVGVLPSAVQWNTAPGVESLTVSDCALLKLPPLGEMVGAAA
jgi:tetrahydromethanopterin S-methyltransferase subunit B